MPWIFYYRDEDPIDIITFNSHPFSMNTYLTVFLPLASLTIYYDAVIAYDFHSFLLPHPSLFCKILLLTDACVSTKDHVDVCDLGYPLRPCSCLSTLLSWPYRSPVEGELALLPVV